MILGVSLAAATLLASPLATTERSLAERPIPLGPVPARVLSIEAPDDAYYRRLDIHRAASYALLPLFALQYFAGDQLYRKSSDAPDWAKVGHRVGATGIAALFVVNVSTGIPNIIAARCTAA